MVIETQNLFISAGYKIFINILICLVRGS